MSNMVLTTGPTLSTRSLSSDESPEVLQFSYYQPPSTRGSAVPVVLGSGIRQPENDVLRQTNELTLEADLADVTNDLLQTRNKLYTEMTRLARLQHQVSRGVEHIRPEVRFQRFTSLLVDIGIPYFTVQRISDALDAGFGTVDHMLVDAIGEAIHDPDSEALLSSLKPVVVGQRVPERYRSALYRTPSVRRKARAQKKVSKVRKCLAPEDDRHAEFVTTSSSNMFFTPEPLDPACQPAVDALITRRANAGSARFVFCEPSVQDGSVLAAPASGFGSEATSASNSTARSQHPIHTSLPSKERFSISELRISRRRAFLGDIGLNVPQSPEMDVEPGNPQQDGREEQSAHPSVALGRDFTEHLDRVALGREYCHSSGASRPGISTSASPFSASFMPMSACDLITDKPFDNSAFHSLLYGTHGAQTDSDPHNSNGHTSTRRNLRFLEHTNEHSTGSLAIRDSVDSMGLANSTGSLAVLDTMASVETSSESFDLSEDSKDSLFMSTRTPTTGPTTPSKTPHTTSTAPSSSGGKLPMLRHLRGRHGFVGSVRKSDRIVRRLSLSPESFIGKLRSLGHEGSTP